MPDEAPAERGATLIVMSGLQAAGKSVVADALGRSLQAPVLSVDPIEAAMWQSGVARDQPTGLAAYVVADILARRQVALGLTVIIDAVNAVAPARDQWRDIARDYGARIRVIEVVCSDEGEHRRRLATRVRDLPGFPEPSWDDVVRVRGEYEPWDEDHLVLDSTDDPDANLARALDYIH